MNSENLKEYWNKAIIQQGHTGFSDSFLYRFDQPTRLKRIRECIELYFQNTRDRINALDIGCGTGDIIKVLLDAGFSKVTGCDISNLVIENTNKRFNADSRVCLINSPVEGLIFPNNTFDLITSITLFQHIIGDDVLEYAFNKLYSFLKQAGCLLALEISPINPIYGSSPTLKERTKDFYVQLFTKIAKKGSIEVFKYTPLPFTLGNIILPSAVNMLKTKLQSHKAPTHGNNNTVGYINFKPKFIRTVRYFSYQLIRKSLIAFSSVPDRFIRFQLSDKITYYHFFLIKKG